MSCTVGVSVVRNEPSPVCEWCGDVGGPDRLLVRCIMSPPVDGYRTETAIMHGCCADAAAAFSVL